MVFGGKNGFLRLGYGVPPTQLAVSFISHKYHYVGMTYYGCGYGAYHNLIKFIQSPLGMWFISWLFLEFRLSAPDFYLIKGEKTVSSLWSISGKAGGGLDEKFSWKKLASWPVASWKC